MLITFFRGYQGSYKVFDTDDGTIELTSSSTLVEAKEMLSNISNGDMHFYEIKDFVCEARKVGLFGKSYYVRGYMYELPLEVFDFYEDLESLVCKARNGNNLILRLKDGVCKVGDFTCCCGKQVSWKAFLRNAILGGVTVDDYSM